MTNSSDITINHLISKREWWTSRRLKYNRGLVIAELLAFLLYAILGSLLIAPHVEEFEITLFTILFQGIGYLFMIGVANVFYGLGPFVDKLYNKKNDEEFRKRLFNWGYWFSFSLPFSVPILVVVNYFIMYS